MFLLSDLNVPMESEFCIPSWNAQVQIPSLAILAKEIETLYFPISHSLKFRSFWSPKTNTLVWGLEIPIIKRRMT